MAYYPISLNLNNKRCIVVGGGKVAERKIRSLLSANANVLIISPDVTNYIKDLAEKKIITWLECEYDSQHLDGSFLVIAATNEREINKKISDYCNQNNILVNVIDALCESSFIVNAYIKQGDLQIAVSTSGKSPALARKIKEELSEKYGPEYGILLDILGEVRDVVKQKIADDRKKVFYELIDLDILDLIKQGNISEAKRRVQSCLSSY